MHLTAETMKTMIIALGLALLMSTFCFSGEAFERHPPMKAPTYEDTVPAWLCLDYDSSFLFNPPVSLE